MKHLFGILTALFILASADQVFAKAEGEKSLSFGDGVAAYSLQNYERAAEIWQSLAEKGSGIAAYRLAQLYDMGLGVAYNPEQAVYWLTSAAEQSHVDAQYMLAGIYASGKGVSVNLQKAYEFYLKSAENGHAKAMYQLASIYYMGEIVEMNHFKSAFWFKKSSESLPNKAQQKIAKDLYDKIFAKLSDSEKLALLRQLAFPN